MYSKVTAFMQNISETVLRKKKQLLQEAQKGQSHLFINIGPCGLKLYFQLDHPFY